MAKYLLFGSTAAIAIVLGMLLFRIKYNRVSPGRYLDENVFQDTGTKDITEKNVLARIGSVEIPVEVADTAYLRAKGLSGRDMLAEDRGMLFVFPTNDQRGAFWMKGMKIPIDIIWIDDGYVSQIMSDIQPPESGTSMTNLKLYVPDGPYDQVVEVNAGFAQKNGLAEGDPVEIFYNE